MTCFPKPTGIASSYSKGFSDMISTVSCSTALAKCRKKSQEHCRKSILVGLMTAFFSNTQHDNENLPMIPSHWKQKNTTRKNSHLEDLLGGTLHPQPWLAAITTGHLRRVFKQQKFPRSWDGDFLFRQL